jgi:hypothetical protein
MSRQIGEQCLKKPLQEQASAEPSRFAYLEHTNNSTARPASFTQQIQCHSVISLEEEVERQNQLRGVVVRSDRGRSSERSMRSRK